MKTLESKEIFSRILERTSCEGIEFRGCDYFVSFFILNHSTKLRDKITVFTKLTTCTLLKLHLSTKNYDLELQSQLLSY